MTNIYDKHDQTFRHVSAYVITDKAGNRVATVAFKFAASGLRTTCYLHIIGQQMASAYAGGGGYDKTSAAVHNACRKILGMAAPEHAPQALGETVANICTAIQDDGYPWDRQLVDAGYQVLRAV